jgi:hemerythrin-like domain-containing protein
MTTPDLTAYRAVHVALRQAPHRMAAAVLDLRPGDHRRVKALIRYWRGYAAEVLAHHTIEDDIMFPALVARVERARAHMERTDAEHHELDDLMARCAAGVASLEHDAGLPVRERVADDLRALAALMDEHLDFEDEQILPLVSEHIDHDEFAALEERASKSMGLGPQAAFAVPFIVDSVDEATRLQLFASAPMPLRVLYRLSHRRYARLERRALGTARPAVPVGV